MTACRTDLSDWGLPPILDAGVPVDAATVIDLAAPSTDLAIGPDMTSPPDFAIGPDLATFPDFAVVPDFATPPDFALGAPDFAVPADLAVPPPDLVVLPDLAVRPDLAQLPTCRDGVRNGNETDVDCGGGTCNACGGGLACKVNGDCAGGTCRNGACKWVFSFGAPSLISSGGNPVSLVAADLDADGVADVAASNTQIGFIGLLLSRGDGTFAPVKLTSGGAQPGALAAGDVDGDGRTDLVAVTGAASIGVLLATGPGAFANPVSYLAGTNPTRLRVVDLDADGRGDVVVANRGVVNGDPGSLGIFRAQVGGALAPMATAPAGTNPSCLAAADLDRDGRLDLAVGNLQWAGVVQVLLGDGKGGFASPQPFLASGNPYAVAAVDLNRDGNLDLAVANAGTQDVSVLLGRGGASYAPRVDTPAGKVPVNEVVSDLDLDGWSDLALVNATGGQNAITILLGKGDGSFAAPLTLTAGSGTGDIAVADFNRDGKPDLVVPDTLGGGVAVLLNTSR